MDLLDQQILDDPHIRGYAIDSRKVEKGFLFFAQKGAQMDGHLFLKQVALKGAFGAVVDLSYSGESFGLILYRVKDVVEKLQQLARTKQKKKRVKVVAITGSVGKTTTKEFIATLLKSRFKIFKTPGNANSQVGLPLSLLNHNGNEEIYVLEMGMTERGGIEKLVKIAPPDIVIITKIGHSHLEAFEDGLEGVASAKAEILSSTQTKLAILNEQVVAFKAIQQALKVNSTPFLTYACDPAQGDYMWKKEGIISEMKQDSLPFHLPFNESHFCENFTGAVAVARQLGLSWEDLCLSATHIQGWERRFEKIERNGIIFINDSYNASPESMQAALLNLPLPSQGGIKIAVFGEMPGLGSFSEILHAELAKVALDTIDCAFCYGKSWEFAYDLFNQNGCSSDYFLDLNELKKSLFLKVKPGDVVLIKGANNNKLWQLLD